VLWPTAVFLLGARLRLANPLATHWERGDLLSVFAGSCYVVRGGVEPPTFRFSGVAVSHVGPRLP
jgi:hypothetical protein